MLDNIRFVLNHLHLYTAIVSTFILLAFNGIVLFTSLFKTKNKILILSGGMIMGPLSVLLILSFLSYLFKGPNAIKIIFSVFTVLNFYVFVKHWTEYKKLFKTRISVRLISFLVIIAFYIVFFLLYAGGISLGGDVSTHWSIATSYARGNYPTVLPWQPQFLTAYHEGGFIVEGAIHAITNANISIIHFFFSTYMVSALFLFIIGMVRQENRGLIGIYPAILATVTFGGPILYIGRLSSLFTEIKDFLFKYSVQLSSYKKVSGTGANNLFSMYYFNFYTFGLCAFLLGIFILLKYHPKNLFKKYLLLVTLSVLILSISEVYFIPFSIFIAFYYFRDIKKTKKKNFINNSLLLAVAFLLLFFVVQNIVRDSMILSDVGKAKFQIAFFNNMDFMRRINYMKANYSQFDNGNIKWYLPNLLILTTLVLAIAIKYKSKMSLIFALSSFFSIILSFLLVDSFWKDSSLRFINQAYQLILISIGFLIVYLNGKSSSKIFRWLAAVLIIVTLPQAITSNANFIKNAINGDGSNLYRHVGEKDITLQWIYENISYDKRVLFIDEYPFTLLYSPLSQNAMMYYGIFVPTGPVKYKLISMDTSGDWYDAITNLSPEAIRDLGVDYVFLKNDQQFRFSDERNIQIGNKQYFNKVYENKDGRLYEVKNAFKKLSSNEMTLKKMAGLIPDGKIVYLGKDRLPMGDARKGFLVALSDRTTLIGPKPVIGGDYFMYISANLPIIRTDYNDKQVSIPEMESIDYAIVSDLENPNNTLKGNFVEIAEIPYVALWQNIEK